MASDRPDDIGQQFPSDATALSLPDVTEGRAQIDYGTRPNSEAFDPVLLGLGLLDTPPGRLFQIALVLDDYIIGYEVTYDVDGEEVIDDANLTIIVKPPTLRKSEYDTDGETDSDGFIVTGVTGQRRSREDVVGGFTVYETIQPAYTTGERIHAIETDASGIPGINLIDINNDGRTWEPEEPDVQYFVIDEVDKDTFNCYVWNQRTKVAVIPEDSSTILIAKPVELQGTVWDGKTINGIDYDVNGGSTEADPFTTRDASDGNSANDEIQDITPVWRSNTSGDDITVIQARYVPTGTGAYRNGEQSVWQDMNNGGHAFALRFA
jgi:hypothetical protein